MLFILDIDIINTVVYCCRAIVASWCTLSKLDVIVINCFIGIAYCCIVHWYSLSKSTSANHLPITCSEVSSLFGLISLVYLLLTIYFIICSISLFRGTETIKIIICNESDGKFSKLWWVASQYAQDRYPFVASYGLYGKKRRRYSLFRSQVSGGLNYFEDILYRFFVIRQNLGDRSFLKVKSIFSGKRHIKQ